MNAEEQKYFEELAKQVEDAAILNAAVGSRAFGIFKEAFSYIGEQAKQALVHVNPDDKTQIIKFQLEAAFYETVMPNIILKVKQDGEAALEQIKENGWAEKLSQTL